MELLQRGINPSNPLRKIDKRIRKVDEMKNLMVEVNQLEDINKRLYWNKTLHGRSQSW